MPTYQAFPGGPAPQIPWHSVWDIETFFTRFNKVFQGKESEDNWNHREQLFQMIRTAMSTTFDWDDEEHTEMKQACISGLRGTTEGFQKGILSLRTQLSVSAGQAVEQIAQTLRGALGPILPYWLLALLKQIGSTKRIVAAASCNAVKAILRHCPYTLGSVTQVIDTLSDKSAQVRIYGASFLECIVERSRGGIGPDQTRFNQVTPEWFERTGALAPLMSAFQKAVADANPIVRTETRRVFGGFADIWPNQAAVVLSRVDGPTKRLVEKALALPLSRATGSGLFARHDPGLSTHRQSVRVVSRDSDPMPGHKALSPSRVRLSQPLTVSMRAHTSPEAAGFSGNSRSSSHSTCIDGDEASREFEDLDWASKVTPPFPIDDRQTSRNDCSSGASSRNSLASLGSTSSTTQSPSPTQNEAFRKPKPKSAIRTRAMAPSKCTPTSRRHQGLTGGPSVTNALGWAGTSPPETPKTPAKATHAHTPGAAYRSPYGQSAPNPSGRRALSGRRRTTGQRHASPESPTGRRRSVRPVVSQSLTLGSHPQTQALGLGLRNTSSGKLTNPPGFRARPGSSYSSPYSQAALSAASPDPKTGSGRLRSASHGGQQGLFSGGSPLVRNSSRIPSRPITTTKTPDIASASLTTMTNGSTKASMDHALRVCTTKQSTAQVLRSAASNDLSYTSVVVTPPRPRTSERLMSRDRMGIPRLSTGLSPQVLPRRPSTSSARAPDLRVGKSSIGPGSNTSMNAPMPSVPWLKGLVKVYSAMIDFDRASPFFDQSIDLGLIKADLDLAAFKNLPSLEIKRHRVIPDDHLSHLLTLVLESAAADDLLPDPRNAYAVRLADRQLLKQRIDMTHLCMMLLKFQIYILQIVRAIGERLLFNADASTVTLLAKELLSQPARFWRAVQTITNLRERSRHSVIHWSNASLQCDDFVREYPKHQLQPFSLVDEMKFQAAPWATCLLSVLMKNAVVLSWIIPHSPPHEETSHGFAEEERIPSVTSVANKVMRRVIDKVPTTRGAPDDLLVLRGMILSSIDVLRTQEGMWMMIAERSTRDLVTPVLRGGTVLDERDPVYIFTSSLATVAVDTGVLRVLYVDILIQLICLRFLFHLHQARPNLNLLRVVIVKTLVLAGETLSLVRPSTFRECLVTECRALYGFGSAMDKAGLQHALQQSGVDIAITQSLNLSPTSQATDDVDMADTDDIISEARQLITPSAGKIMTANRSRAISLGCDRKPISSTMLHFVDFLKECVQSLRAYQPFGGPQNLNGSGSFSMLLQDLGQLADAMSQDPRMKDQPLPPGGYDSLLEFSALVVELMSGPSDSSSKSMATQCLTKLCKAFEFPAASRASRALFSNLAACCSLSNDLPSSDLAEVLPVALRELEVTLEGENVASHGDESVQAAREAFTIIEMILKRCEILECSTDDLILPVLKGFESGDQEVRRHAISALVAIHYMLARTHEEGRLQKHLQSLSFPQRKLVDIYIARERCKPKSSHIEKRRVASEGSLVVGTNSSSCTSQLFRVGADIGRPDSSDDLETMVDALAPGRRDIPGLSDEESCPMEDDHPLHRPHSFQDTRQQSSLGPVKHMRGLSGPHARNDRQLAPVGTALGTDEEDQVAREKPMTPLARSSGTVTSSDRFGGCVTMPHKRSLSRPPSGNHEDTPMTPVEGVLATTGGARG